MATSLSVAALANLMAGDAPYALLDVRERGEYNRGHIFTATSLPRGLLEFRAEQVAPSKRVPVVLCDDDGRRAALAGRTLEAMGYEDVRLLTDGVGAWQAAGLTFVEGTNVPSKAFGEQVLVQDAVPEITVDDLHGRIAEGQPLVILDARTPDEYQSACIPGAISVPGGELPLRIADLLRDADGTIVVHCAGRTRSIIGARTLAWMGIENVRALRNGTMGWQLAGFELERGAERFLDAPPSPEARRRAQGFATGVRAETGVQELLPAELQALQARAGEEAVYLIDTRTAEEYAAGHVPGARHIPGGQAVQTGDDQIGIRAGTVVFICDDRARSSVTAAWFRRMGYPRVAVLTGGLDAWTAAGLPLEQGAPAAPPPFGLEAARARVASVTPDTLATALNGSPPLVLDVGTSRAFGRGHIPGARWLLRSRLEPAIAELAPDRATPIVVTCSDGVNSTLAAAALLDLGYTAVSVLAGGTQAWASTGRALETGLTGVTGEPDDIVPPPYARGPAAMERYLEWEERMGHGQMPVPPGRKEPTL
jgi:rhodanese-related sulfurtransferase